MQKPRVCKGDILKSVPLRCGHVAFAKLQRARAFACRRRVRQAVQPVEVNSLERLFYKLANGL